MNIIKMIQSDMKLFLFFHRLQYYKSKGQRVYSWRSTDWNPSSNCHWSLINRRRYLNRMHYSIISPTTCTEWYQNRWCGTEISNHKTNKASYPDTNRRTAERWYEKGGTVFLNRAVSSDFYSIFVSYFQILIKAYKFENMFSEMLSESSYMEDNEP